MSKILMINGSPNEKGCTYTALSEVAAELEKNGVESEIIWLGKKPMQDCINCKKCFELGRCVFDDLVNVAAAKMAEADGLIVGSPVYFSGASGRLTSFLDRLFYSTDKNIFALKPAAAVVSCRRGGATATFNRLNLYFGLKNMLTIGSQYWNQVHGFTPDDVRKDLEGLQTMRTLAKNMAYTVKCLAAGKDNGVERPEYEEVVMTNFID